MSIPSAVASACTVWRPGSIVVPRSIEPYALTVSPAAWARSSCDRPAALR